jgi:cytochrome c-type biogenesis protein CcmH/NrfG
MERVDEAKALLENLAAKDPKDVSPLDALGNILRAHERYGEARDYYTRALALIPNPPRTIGRCSIRAASVTSG